MSKVLGHILIMLTVAGLGGYFIDKVSTTLDMRSIIVLSWVVTGLWGYWYTTTYILPAMRNE